ncbi:hypothetical protein BDQ94DRAFT_118878 [Aspergillus welwitschiae]|uniref:Uncharacterized protein n=1 Tax=Aspergillus welwitschiae TaxID=1341132 RepID=A0A3F3PLK4_9EURO|nr:hypothetical protein BDQ94DRAFT_118878 [Aspergillus welwitschiae]RDH27236.1 hypothetical protein BDQ94DRAFT_118878 [Aspergillus welwitschiae]
MRAEFLLFPALPPHPEIRLTVVTFSPLVSAASAVTLTSRTCRRTPHRTGMLLQTMLTESFMSSHSLEDRDRIPQVHLLFSLAANVGDTRSFVPKEHVGLTFNESNDRQFLAPLAQLPQQEQQKVACLLVDTARGLHSRQMPQLGVGWDPNQSDAMEYLGAKLLTKRESGTSVRSPKGTHNILHRLPR